MWSPLLNPNTNHGLHNMMVLLGTTQTGYELKAFLPVP
jgi:hypothetical protein